MEFDILGVVHKTMRILRMTDGLAIMEIKV